MGAISRLDFSSARIERVSATYAQARVLSAKAQSEHEARLGREIAARKGKHNLR